MRRSYPARLAVLLVALAVPTALVVLPAVSPAAARDAAPEPPAARAAGGPVVATDDATYGVCGRVFADPHAHEPGPALPNESPFAKGNAACRAATFISYAEAVAGLTYLEKRFPQFVELYEVGTDFAGVLDDAQGDGLSAGLATTGQPRDRSPLYLLRITDERVPEAQKKLFAVALSIHGIERAGVEGGLRAAEDLATWGATAPEQRIMETLDDSLPAGEVLRQSSVYFILANPDGWRRGDLTEGAPAFSRYNGNGVDLNRDWPAMGYTYKPYTAWSEPESRTFGKVLKSIRAKWDGGLDLHGQLTGDSFSFTLLRSSQRDYAENSRMLQYVTGAWKDAEARLSWSSLIKPNDNQDANDPRLYGVKWGTTWDTIGYTNTGSISNWFDDDLGLGADAISNEMSFSHVSNCGTGNCFLPEIEQLHVDGNKSLIYGLVNYTLLPEDDRMRFVGRAAYVDHGTRLTRKPAVEEPPGTAVDESQQPFSVVHDGQNPSTFEFEVPVPVGGLRAQVDYVGIGGAGTGVVMRAYLDRFAEGDDHADKDGDGWEEVQADNAGTEPQYAPTGAQLDVATPQPGRYRVRITGNAPGPVSGYVQLTKALAVEDPGQRALDASNTDFFPELRADLADPSQLGRVTSADLLAGRAPLSSYDTVMASDRAFAAARTPAARAALGSRLAAWVRAGGNLVLTDDAMQALSWMGLVGADDVEEKAVYAGNVEFRDPSNPESTLTYDDELAAGVDQPGAAEGTGNRHQITDPGPIGYAIMTATGGDAAVQPQWVVSADAWADAGGRTTGVLGTDVTLGELRLGQGRVRVLGSLIPMPTAEFDVPLGVSDYAITYAGYEVVRNLLSWRNPNGTTAAPVPDAAPAPPAAAPPAAPLPATGAGAPLAAVAALLCLLALAARARGPGRA
jgi:hypothetical protein